MVRTRPHGWTQAVLRDESRGATCLLINMPRAPPELDDPAAVKAWLDGVHAMVAELCPVILVTSAKQAPLVTTTAI